MNISIRKLMFPYASYVVALIAAALIMSGCSTPAPIRETPVNFAEKASYSLDVQKIDFVSSFKPSMKEPNVEHLLQPTFPEHLKSWAANRLKPKGGDRTLRIVVDNASIVAVKLPQTKGITGLFTKDQSTRYDGVLTVSLKILNGTELLPESELNVAVNRSRTVSEDLSPAARNDVLNNVAQLMMKDLDAEVEKQMAAYFGRYIIN